MRLIDGDELLKHEKVIRVKELGYSHRSIDPFDVMEAPTIEAEPIKHGRWLIGVGENGEPIGTYYSECGWSWVNGVAAVNLNKGFSLIKTPRCPWCGAKMDEVDNG